MLTLSNQKKKVRSTKRRRPNSIYINELHILYALIEKL